MPLKTSGKDLCRLLERSGARHRLEGADKLDLLVWLADQVKYSIEARTKMTLQLSELMSLLEREGLAPEGRDAKGAVGGLLALRRRELARLDYDERARQAANGDARFEMALALMSPEQVAGCFALVPVASKTADLASATNEAAPLPGQVVETPRRGGGGGAGSSTARSGATSARGGTSARGAGEGAGLESNDIRAAAAGGAGAGTAAPSMSATPSSAGAAARNAGWESEGTASPSRSFRVGAHMVPPPPAFPPPADPPQVPRAKGAPSAKKEGEQAKPSKGCDLM